MNNRKHKNDFYNSYVEALTTTNCSLYGRQLNHCYFGYQSSPPRRKADHSWAITDLEKAKILAEHLFKLFQRKL